MTAAARAAGPTVLPASTRSTATSPVTSWPVRAPDSRPRRSGRAGRRLASARLTVDTPAVTARLPVVLPPRLSGAGLSYGLLRSFRGTDAFAAGPAALVPVHDPARRRRARHARDGSGAVPVPAGDGRDPRQCPDRRDPPRWNGRVGRAA